MDVRIDDGVGRSMRNQHFLSDELVSVGVVLAARHHERMGRCAEPGVDRVDLEPRRAALQKTEIADQLLIDALKHPGDPRIRGGWQAAIVAAMVEALADKANAREALRRSAVASPQPAIFASEAVVIFAGLCRPGAHTTLGAPHFDDARPGWMVRDLPVEAVASKVHQPAAAAHVGL